MKERGILFMPSMTAAIIENRKTVTRRIIKNQPDSRGFRTTNVEFEDWHGKKRNCPYGKAGDVLYVRENYFHWGTWAKKGKTKTGKTKLVFIPSTETYRTDLNVLYNDDPPKMFATSPPKEWTTSESLSLPRYYKRNALFMPKEHSRLWLEITDIKVQRIQDITEEDVYAEGVRYAVSKTDNPELVRPLIHAMAGEFLPENKDHLTSKDFAIAEFARLWNEINGKVADWRANPFVWCVSFKRIEKPVS